MLPSFIIEQLRQREKAKPQPVQPQLELPLPPINPRTSDEGSDDKDRGVIVLDVLGDD